MRLSSFVQLSIIVLVNVFIFFTTEFAAVQAQDEPPEGVVVVGLHHVPQNRPAADLYERLGDRVRLLAQPRASATAEDRDGNFRR